MDRGVSEFGMSPSLTLCAIQAKDWVRKLSKSILKKISEGSTTAFAGLQGRFFARQR